MSRVNTKPTFSLGKFFFSFASEDLLLKRAIEKLFVLDDSGDVSHEVHVLDLDEPKSISKNWKRHELSDGSLDLVRIVQMRAIEHHAGMIWLNAAMLIKPGAEPKSVLLVGKPLAGKTTLAYALSAAHGWLIVADDLLFIDQITSETMRFAAPQSIRLGSLELMQKLDIKIPQLELDCWAPPHGRSIAEHQIASFDYILHLSYAPSQIERCDIVPINAATSLRKTVTCSNLIAIDAVDHFARYMNTAACFDVTGGTLQERMAGILKIVP